MILITWYEQYDAHEDSFKTREEALDWIDRNITPYSDRSIRSVMEGKFLELEAIEVVKKYTFKT